MDNRHQKVMLETDRHRISGQVTLAREGYRSRISDMLNASERDFIALTNVSVEALDGGEVTNYEFMAVARTKIVFAVPLSD
ncbi:MAG TPA: hypothetical protein VHX66_01735 [Solirubrobacteraceae bacterium]|jgi:hypothetical protein|nr:hypothetical protein [Solirubrobacteraceae bacterium]